MNTETHQTEPKVYFIVFEEYLKPKLPFKTRNLQSFIEKTENENRSTDFKLSESTQNRFANRWCSCLKKLKQKKLLSQNSKAPNIINTQRENKFFRELLGFDFHFRSLFSFFHQPKSHDVCKRKTNFEIYCEMASIHGFSNFIGARLWQRLFWGLIILLAICMSCFVITQNFMQGLKRPTIFLAEGITEPAWHIPFPAITICNLNRISQHESLKLADQFLSHSSLTRHEILRLFRLTLYASTDANITKDDLVALEMLLKHNNYTITNLLREISPKCESKEFKLCKWKSHHERCQHMLKEVQTPYGTCCSFNFLAYEKQNCLGPEQITSSGPQTGFSVVMNPDVQDLSLSKHKFVGYEVYIHDSLNIQNEFTESQFISARTESSISVTPLSVYGTHYLRKRRIALRRCYFPDEYKLVNFQYYSLPNCLAECRSRLMYEKCKCLPPFWPKLLKSWIFCQSALQINCSLTNRDILSQLVEKLENNDFEKLQSENFICNCLPLCTYNQYTSIVESSPLDRNFSLIEQRLFRGVENIQNFTLLHVYYGDLIARKFRLDVNQNWLSGIGTIGGIAGLYMGFSFISICELIFFVLVRPLCNWVTKQEIRYKNKKKIKKNAAEKSEKAKVKEQSEN